MLRRLVGDLPEWAQANHPLLRYELQRRGPRNPSARVAQVMSWAVLWVALVAGGYLIATNGLTETAGAYPTTALWKTLFFPLIGLQLLLRAAAVSLGVNTIGDERRRQTWDPMRVTEQGAALALRTRWAAILLYHLRGLLSLVYITRLLLLGALLFELVTLRGDFLGRLMASSAPSVPFLLGVILLALMLTAIFLLPLTATGVDVAVGLWIATTYRQRAYATIVQIIYISARVVIFGFLLWGALQFLNGAITLCPVANWSLLMAWSALGDWGVTLLQLGQTGQLIWSQVPFSNFYGVILLGVLAVQVGIASGILSLAIRNAERRE